METTTTIDPEQTLGSLVEKRPALAPILERLRLDYCCGGSRTLSEACRSRGLDPVTVAVALERLEGLEQARFDPHDLRRATLPELCDHVVAMHHERLRRELPHVEKLLATVVRVHGTDHRELHDLERLYSALARDLLEHLDSEEGELFPAIRALAAGEPSDPELTVLVAEHGVEHAQVGDGLAALRELAGGYAPERAYCNTHRRLLEALEDLEQDLHQHVHEENNLLFPRALAAAGV